ncbi:hypothetical protein [Longimicrobium sp.]|uniref:hypothetical protein n=1 Tax=Longimicrobium sp. TaxID=2029185 RepID=UPI002E369BAE|nr:hypothetical protein [Longimicrobium sp.]HEX6038906.1 hypothetical protein [Longimicrobium sp.]
MIAVRRGDAFLLPIAGLFGFGVVLVVDERDGCAQVAMQSQSVGLLSLETVEAGAALLRERAEEISTDA